MKNHTAGSKQREAKERSLRAPCQSAFLLWGETGSRRRFGENIILITGKKDREYFAEEAEFGFHAEIIGLCSASKNNVVRLA
jgi:hypothetical protein